MPLQEIEPNHWVGEDSALMLLRPVDDVLRALSKVGINLLAYDITVTGVYTRPRPRGFDFQCGRVEALLGAVQALSRRALPRGPTDFQKGGAEPVFNPDRGDSVEGTISAGVTKGQGFRQIGTGEVLHFEIELSGRCNVHLDTHGYVVGPGRYDWGRSGLQHGYWDLLSDKAPGLFGAFGERGKVGPMARPMRGVDGQLRWTFGLTGEW